MDEQRCQSRYGGRECHRPAVYRYHATSYPSFRLCQECADRLCDTPDRPHVGRQMRGRLERLEPDGLGEG